MASARAHSAISPFVLGTPHGYAELSLSEHAYVDSMYADHGLSMPHHVAGSCFKRRREFFFGRVCKELATTSLRARRNGRPENSANALEAACGCSISHTDRVVAALCIPAHVGRVGFDVEHVMGVELAGQLLPSIAGLDEISLVRDLGLDRPSTATLLFSLKEAAYKACSWMFQGVPGFRNARVAAIDSSARSSLVDFASPCGASGVVQAYFDLDADTVRTCALWRTPLTAS